MVGGPSHLSVPPQARGRNGSASSLVMDPNVRTYLFHPLAQVIGCLSVWPWLKRRVMDGSFDRGELASAFTDVLLSERASEQRSTLNPVIPRRIPQDQLSQNHELNIK